VELLKRGLRLNRNSIQIQPVGSSCTTSYRGCGYEPHPLAA
jgi:hypothetical protein